MAYTGYLTLTYDHTKVGSSDLTNFPIPFFGTYSYLATTVNGGFITNINGFDIVITSDQAGLTIMDFELKNYDPTTGQVEFWVKIPTLSHTVDTVIYLQYGNSGISTDQSNKHAVWDTNFKFVAHLGTSSSLELTDSTVNVNTGINHGATSIAGEIIGGANFVNASSNYIDFGTAYTAVSQANQTLEAWVKIPNQNARYVFGARSAFVVFSSGGLPQIVFRTTNTFLNQFDLPGPTISTTTWHYIVGTTDGVTKKIYVDNVLQATDTTIADWNGTLGIHLTAGAFNDGTANFFLDGSLDELRLSNVARSADWINATYNFITTPPTFSRTQSGQFVVNNPL